MLCKLSRSGPFLRLNLGEKEDPAIFAKILDLATGVDVQLNGGMEELLALGIMADRFLIDPIRLAVERKAMTLMSPDSCMRVMCLTHGTGMLLLAAAAREWALHNFDDSAASPSLLDLPADLFLQLLQDDALVAHGEDTILNAVLAWAAAPEHAALSAPLLCAVRYRFVRPSSVAKAVAAASPELRVLLVEAMASAGVKYEDAGAITQACCGGRPDGSMGVSEAKTSSVGAPELNSGRPAKMARLTPSDATPEKDRSTTPTKRDLLLEMIPLFFSRRDSEAMQRLDTGAMAYALAAYNSEVFVSEEGGAIQVRPSRPWRARCSRREPPE